MAAHAPSANPAAARYAAFDPAQLTGLVRERWKYTRLPPFAEALAAVPSANALTASTELGADSVTHPSALSTAVLEDSAQWHPYPLADAIFASTEGWSATVSPGADVEGALTLDDGKGHGLVQLGESAAATLSLELRSQQAAFGTVQFEIGANAALTLDTTALDVAGIGWLLTRFALHANARLTLRQYFTGAGNHRHETHILMAGPGAEARLMGAAIGHPASRFDQQVVLEHAAPNATSHQRFHCAGLAASRSNFNGRIHIHPGARATVAELSNRNLALTQDAQLNTKPELEIYNDDVRCAHGATVGQLDADALYYCQSRGIPEAHAKRLLTSGFLQQCVTGPSAERVADAIRARIT